MKFPTIPAPSVVPQWVRELTEEVMGPAPFAVGDIVTHPDGRRVKIVAGQYWGTHGISNHWTWHEVHEDGSISDVEEHGYGWHNPNPEGA